MTSPFTRRDFLKLGGTGVLAAFLLEISHTPALAVPRTSPVSAFARLGRVAWARVRSYSEPTTQAPQASLYPRDTLLTINAQVSADGTASHNRAWYQLAKAEYVHSAGIQPVRDEPNELTSDLPADGTVGEISVPYTTSHWAMDRTPFPGPRLYYASTHWIASIFTAPNGVPWYRAHDPLFNAYYYIPAAALRILPASELAPISPHLPETEKSIQIQLDEQRLVAFEGGRQVFDCLVSTGKGEFFTPQGDFSTFHKRPSAHMVGGESDAAMYDLTGVPWCTYLTENGVAIHGTFWHNDYGTPRSHGCINLKPEDARFIYRWTLPVVPPGRASVYLPGQGTRVLVAESNQFNLRRWL